MELKARQHVVLGTGAIGRAIMTELIIAVRRFAW